MTENLILLPAGAEDERGLRPSQILTFFNLKFFEFYIENSPVIPPDQGK